MTVFFTGLGSASDRTVFTRKGPIVKKPLALLSGANLAVVSPCEVSVPTRPFLQSHEGKLLSISGTPGGRNDGRFRIDRVLSSSRVRLAGASLDWADEVATVDRVLGLANELKLRYNSHAVRVPIHANADTFNPSTGGFAVDVASAILLLNQLRSAFAAHVALLFSTGGLVHVGSDDSHVPQAPPAYNVPSALMLANDLRRRFELHRQSDSVHEVRDLQGRVQIPEARPVLGSGPLVGPFSWTLYDPRSGVIADDPSDVAVLVNGLPASVDAVYGLLGAVVLTSKPAHGSTVAVDYSFLANPPTQFERLNTPEFVLNGAGSGATVGLPGHAYRARSYLMDPKDHGKTVASAVKPRRVGWKYKGLERQYTAVLNDPNTLLLNVPGNRVAYPVLDARAVETTLRYDPTTLPDSATDRWTLEGDGTFILAPGGGELTVVDTSIQTGPGSRPPFYTHALDLGFPSTVSAAFRMRAEAGVPDGVVVGPGFGVSDGSRAAVAGLLETRATNLSSAISMANDIRAKFNAHLVQLGVHRPNGTPDAVDVVEATDLTSLLILLNRTKQLYDLHLSRGSLGDGSVHVAADTANVALEPDATLLGQAVALVNVLRDRFNSHRTYPGVHYVDDGVNAVGTVKQVGLLVDSGAPELEESWASSSHDWTVTTTYRLFRDAEGDASLYAGGDVVPLASVAAAHLPAASDVELRLDPAQQAFFGSLSRQASSTSRWSFVRVNVTPLDFDQVSDNKSVDYVSTSVPERDPFAPWITIGQGGFDHVVAGKLVLDSTSSAPAGTADALGLTTGAYRGFLRLEPILQRTNSSSFEFTASVGYYSFSLDNRASGVFLDDGDLSVHVMFLQETPSPASVVGTLSEPFPLVAGDTAIIALGDAAPVTVTFQFPVSDAFNACVIINAQLPFPLASPTGDGSIQFVDQAVGAASKIQIVGGHVIEKLGIQVGTYFGKDSNPEPKVSWFGADLPDRESPAWSTGGFQPVRLLGRAMRVTDSDSSDYRAYSFTDPLFLSVIMAALSDWKLDFRCRVNSFVRGDRISAGSNLRPCGVLVNADEGPTGKNVEIQLSVDESGAQYVNVLTYDAGLSALVSVAELPFAWADGRYHSYDVYTSKAANLVIVLADNAPVGTFAYSALAGGFAGPAVTFGSGSEPVANADPRSARSVVDWASVCVFRDAKVSDPLAVSRRFLGMYKGGDPSLLSSYYLHQVDWTQVHTYRIVRDPTSYVSVYVDGGTVPVISVNYDTLTLPPASSSFLRGITNARHCVAFGSFNPFEVDRTVWSRVTYSIGKITLTDRRIPVHQVSNFGNAVASPEHLRTASPHAHFGFGVWSGGTPVDDFLADPGVPAFTVLGEGTPPVPMTQDLESRGGLVKYDVSVESVPSKDFVNTKGFIGDLEDDVYNRTSAVPFVQELVLVANELVRRFNRHLTAFGHDGSVIVAVHSSSDTADSVSSVATDLTTAYSVLNQLKAAFNSHIAGAAYHPTPDSLNVISTPDATSVASAYLLVNAVAAYMTAHFHRWLVHLLPDKIHGISGLDAVDFPTLSSLLGKLRDSLNAHSASTAYHVGIDYVPVTLPDPGTLSDAIFFVAELRSVFPFHEQDTVEHPSYDFSNGVTFTSVFDLPTCLVAANDLKAKFNGHLLQSGVHFVADRADEIPDAGVDEPSANAVAFVNDLKARYNRHLVQSRVHLNSDPSNAVLLPDAATANQAAALANAIKSRVNRHRAAVVGDSGSQVHTLHDSVNAVTAPDAGPGDVDALSALCYDLWSKYSAHLVQPGVHGSSVLIRLDPPSRVLYEGMKFYTHAEGEIGHVAPFSDDETLHMDGLKLQGTHSVGLSGLALPSHAQLVGVKREPFVVQGSGEFAVSVDHGPPTFLSFLPGDTTVAAVVARINAAFAYPLARDSGDGRVVLVSPTAGPGSHVYVLPGYSGHHVGLEEPGIVPWTRVSDVDAQVDASLVSAGPVTALRYETLALVQTVYRAPTGLPDSTSLDFEVTFSVRINSWSVDSTGDTSIYAGVSGSVGNGFTVAVGFEESGGARYVKLVDLRSMETVYRVLFDWGDAAFHTYKIVRSALKNSVSLVIVS